MSVKLCVLVCCSLALMACSQEQIESATRTAGAAYNESHRDSVIRNWQNRVADSEQCAQFKERMRAAGERYTSAANAAFVADMNKVKKAAQIANCLHEP